MIRNNLSAANVRFGLKLYNEVLKQNTGSNLFISPASVAIALAMTYNGANGETQQAMAQALELQDMTLQEVNEAYAALKASLENPDPKVQLNIANSLWVRQGITFNPDFLQRNELYFRAEVSELNFSDPNAATAINDWVNKNTNGKIQQIVDQIPPEMVLYLINAIYFKGTWTKEFDKAKTQDQPFHLLDGSQQQVPLMSQSGQYQYLKGPNFQAVSLPYGEGTESAAAGRISMYVFLPDEGSTLAEFHQSLSAANWNTWMGQFNQAEGDVKLPRFKLEYQVNLNEALQALGMSAAFDPQQADFSAMRNSADENLYISEVKHKTFVEVNEEGTEAAAVTSVGVGTTALQESPQRFTMTVDRPFFFAIRDNSTGMVLFMGSITQP
ncbi:MAG: serpin family protein [Chloroflexi bacterium]|nr:serpin family protein [Chloroflexota bacterium]